VGGMNTDVAVLIDTNHITTDVACEPIAVAVNAYAQQSRVHQLLDKRHELLKASTMIRITPSFTLFVMETVELDFPDHWTMEDARFLSWQQDEE
jgi:hypothetical protein